MALGATASRGVSAHSFQRYRSLIDRGAASDPFRLRVSISGAAENQKGEFVLYWAQTARRLQRNPALNYAVARANAVGLPVVVYESIRSDYEAANDRIHTFVLQGVADNQRQAAERGLRYVFFLPRTTAEARGQLRRVARRARLVVTDEFPTGVSPQQTARFAASAPTAVELLDGNGILPMRAFPKEQYSARFFRDGAHRLIEEYWNPVEDLQSRSPLFSGDLDLPEYDGADAMAAAATCEIDHAVLPVALTGGRAAALRQLAEFVADRLPGYSERRNHQALPSSGLSPWVHFGHIGAAEIVESVLRADVRVEDSDAFLEQLVIRRELSFNLCHYRSDFDKLSAVPTWARATLEKHRHDRRAPVYSYAELENAQTTDDVWNAAQRGLLHCGTIHNYLRMLWGKKIIEWSATPEEALSSMLRLHDRYAIDGRDPNTYAGTLWCFGKHDRPWAPERPIFGTIRYMSSESAKRKVDVKGYNRAVDGCAKRFATAVQDGQERRATTRSLFESPRSPRQD